MNEYAMLHMPESKYCFPVGSRDVVIRFRMAKEDEKAKVTLIYACKYEFHENRQEIPMEIKYSDRLYIYYEIHLRLSDVRLAYIFQIEDDNQIHYFCEDGLIERYCFEEGFYNFFQLPYINGNDVMPMIDWMRQATFYQIFVDRFCMGNQTKDTSYINMKWDDKPTPKSFAGGDLRGIIEKLDYLAELGITAIYLTPIFQSKSNHKYDTIDYMMIDPQFGTKADLAELVSMAHEKGIRIVLDAVFNHCSMKIRQFEDVQKRGRASRFYDWFVIRGDFPNPDACNYECFATCNYMPKLNTANEGVQDFLIQIALYWIREFDIDGWRLDVSDEISHAFWRKFREAVKKEKPEAVIIGENWHDAYPYLQGDQYDSIMNYAYTKACLDYFARQTFNAKQMADKLNSNLMRNMEQVNYMMLNLLDSHDTHRFFSEIKKDKDKLLAALALTMVFPGTPCIYYGTEICMEGGYDPDSRRGFCWDENKWDKNVHAKIKELIHLRKETVFMATSAKVYEKEQMLVVRRESDMEWLTLYVNMTGYEKHLTVSKQMCILSQNHAQMIQRDVNMAQVLVIEKEGYVVVKETKPV